MILVTGGTGLVGAHLLFDILQKEDKVRAIKRRHSSLKQLEQIFSIYTSSPQNLLSKIEWVEAELLDYFSLEEALQGVERVYHCAAMVSFNKKDKHKMLIANIEGTKNLVNACLYQHIEKLVHVSSIAALGRAEKGESANEKTPWKDGDKDSSYSISKYQSEMEVWRGIAEGLNAVIINPSVILGPGDWSKGSPSFFNMVAKGMKYYSYGMNGYVYVRDVSKAMIALMDSDINGERFVLNGEDLTYLEFFNMMAKSLNKPLPSVEAKPWMMSIAWRGAYIKGLVTGKTPGLTKSTALSFMSSYSYSSEKIVKALNFEFTALQKAILLIGDCYLQNKKP